MTTYKLTAVLNEKIGIGKAMNALAHMTAGLVGSLPDVHVLELINYEDKDGGAHLASKHPFIILTAKNSNKLRELKKSALEKGVHCTSFTSAMTVGTWEEQVNTSKATPDEALEYYGVCLFGEKEVVEDLTRKFSLWKS